MEIQKNKFYKIKVNLFGREEIYEGKVLEMTGNEFRFETKENFSCRALTFKIQDVICLKEILEPKKEEKIFKIYSRKTFKEE